MMTLDEAIAHARDVAKQKYAEGMLCHANPNDDKLDGCIKCAGEHEQLAEWLEELKAIKSNGRYVQGNKARQKIGYNNGIDDFAEKFIYKAVCEGCSGCCNCYEESRQNECEDYKSYMEIAEQLKDGV